MARYANGQPIRLSTTITDIASGALVNAGSLALTVQKPDLTTAVFSSPANDGTGLYHQDLAAATDLTQNGHYQYKWVATGSGAGVSVGAFDVYDPFEPQILSLKDAKAACNIQQSITRYDGELQDMVATTESILERLTGGPIFTRSVTELGVPLSKFYTQIILKYRPIVDIVSITDWLGASQPITDVKIDSRANVLYRAGGLPFLGAGAVVAEYIRFDVVYHAGWGVTVPSAFLTAARIIIQDIWTTQRGPADNPSIGGLGLTPQEAALEASYGAPAKALHVLSPYVLEAYV